MAVAILIFAIEQDQILIVCEGIGGRRRRRLLSVSCDGGLKEVIEGVWTGVVRVSFGVVRAPLHR